MNTPEPLKVYHICTPSLSQYHMSHAAAVFHMFPLSVPLLELTSFIIGKTERISGLLQEKYFNNTVAGLLSLRKIQSETTREKALKNSFRYMTQQQTRNTCTVSCHEISAKPKLLFLTALRLNSPSRKGGKTKKKKPNHLTDNSLTLVSPSIIKETVFLK